MDVAHPIRAAVPTLDGPVLEALAGTRRPLTSGEVHRIAGTGSLNGVRRALARLVDQGLVHAQVLASTTLYSGNRDHLAWPAVEILARIRQDLLERLRAEFGAWRVAPSHASLFGSTARGDGDAESDIDLLLLRPQAVGEDDLPWADQVDDLRQKVQAWTGNRCQTFQIDMERLTEHVRSNDPLVQEWVTDCITLAGPAFKTLRRQIPSGGNR